jgi:hypothetical protein
MRNVGHQTMNSTFVSAMPLAKLTDVGLSIKVPISGATILVMIDDDWQRPVVWPAQQPVMAIVDAGDELPVSPAVVAVDDEICLPEPFNVWPTYSATVFYSEELRAPVVDEDYQLPNVARPQVWTPVIFVDQEELLMLWVDQEDHWTAQVTAIAWTPVTFLDQDELPILCLEQEEPWIARRQSQPWTPVTFTDDELYPMLFVDQEDHWTPQVISSIWTPVVFIDQDELPMLLIEHDQWLVVGEQQIQWTPIVFASDDVLAAPAVVVVKRKHGRRRRLCRWPGKPCYLPATKPD